MRCFSDLTVVAIGLDDADILVDRAAGGPDIDGSEVHVVKYTDGRDGNQAKNWGDFTGDFRILSLRYPEKPSSGLEKNPGKIAESERVATAGGLGHPKHRLVAD